MAPGKTGDGGAGRERSPAAVGRGQGSVAAAEVGAGRETDRAEAVGAGAGRAAASASGTGHHGRRRAAAPVSIDDLPDSIIWEILVRLPSKDVGRCRAVRRSWLSWTSTREFMLEHHRRQPSLPLVQYLEEDPFEDCAKDPRLVALRAVESTDANGEEKKELRPTPILRHATPGDSVKVHIDILGALDGLLLVSNTEIHTETGLTEECAYICNPATRQCVALEQIPIHDVVGFYRHSSGEHRLLYNIAAKIDCDSIHLALEYTHGSIDLALEECIRNFQIKEYYILALGSDEPRSLGAPPAAPLLASLHRVWNGGLPSISESCSVEPPVLYRGGLHWGGLHDDSAFIVVFDTEEETFRSIGRPVLSRDTILMEMNGSLGLCSMPEGGFLIDFWSLEDYDTELWEFKYQINLSVVVVSPPLNLEIDAGGFCTRAIVLNEHEVLIQVPERMFVCGIDGKFLRDVKQFEEHQYMQVTFHWHKESILPLPDMEKEDNRLLMPFLLGI